MNRQAHIFKVQAWSLGMTLDDFTDEEWRLQPEGMNHAVWILGHILLNRKGLANHLGMSEEITDCDNLFDVGTSPMDVPVEVEGPALLAEYQELQARFIEHLEAMTEEDLAVETEVEFPLTPKNRLGALQFLLMHEAYHMGQLGVLRVMAGKGSWMKRMQ